MFRRKSDPGRNIALRKARRRARIAEEKMIDQAIQSAMRANIERSRHNRTATAH